MPETKVSFPHLGSYCVPIEYLFTRGVGVDYVTPPPITRRTLEIGSRYSPDTVCAPFKYNLGNYIETIEAGANTLVQTGGVCRLGYYGELHEQILRDLGYKVRFVNMARASYSNPASFYSEFLSINPDLSLKRVAAVLTLVLKMVEHIDAFESYMRNNVGFECEEGSFDRLHQDFLASLSAVESHKELSAISKLYMRRLKELPINRPKNPLRVGIIGEYYTIMEPFSNHFMEKSLARMGIAVDRWINISNTLLHNPSKKVITHIKDYAKYDMGATAMFSIDKALEFAKKHYDGIIHVKSFGCTPEIDAMTVLQNISNDYKIPILYFSFDSQTSETGIQTRLEAFYDMIVMRKEDRK